MSCLLLVCVWPPGVAIPQEAQPNDLQSTLPAFSLTPEQAVAEALRGSPLIEAMNGEVEAAFQARDAARAPLNPTLAVEPLIARDFVDAEIRLAQTLEISGRRRLRTRVAEEGLYAAQAGRAEAVLDLILSVETAFHNLLAAQRAVAIARENEALAQQLLDTARAQLDAGDVPRLDVIRAEVEFARVRQEVARDQAALHLAQAALNEVLGRAPADPVEVVDELEELPDWQDPPDPLQTALTQRPALRAAQAQVLSARAQVDLERSARRPDLVVQYFRNEDRSNFFGVGIELPLWDRGGIRHSVRRAESEVRVNESRLKAARWEVTAQVRQVLVQAAAAARLARQYRTDVLERLEELMEKTVIGYQEGLLTSLDVLEAQRSLSGGRREYVELRADYARARARVGRILGTSVMTYGLARVDAGRVLPEEANR